MDLKTITATPEIDPSMSNFEGVIEEGMAEQLRANPGGCHSRHYAWEFCGVVWYQDEQFHEIVQRYGAEVGRYSADTLDELRDEVNAEWGWD